MSPRGVAIPEVRKQLFDAAERVLLRDGPSGLTGRAITREAGCATGLLYSHFADLDRFLAELFLDRAHAAAAGLEDFPARAGTGSVADNLMDAVEFLFGANTLALAGLAMARPSIIAHLGHAIGSGSLQLNTSELMFTAYLDAEQAQGRVAAEADTESLALALVGAAHQLLLTRGAAAPDLRERMRRVIEALTSPGAV